MNTNKKGERMNICRIFISICLPALAACAQTPENRAMKPDNFWFIFLETGKKTPDDKALVAQMQRGHTDNFKRLFGEQKLFAAGPPTQKCWTTLLHSTRGRIQVPPKLWCGGSG